MCSGGRTDCLDALFEWTETTLSFVFGSRVTIFVGQVTRDEGKLLGERASC